MVVKHSKIQNECIHEQIKELAEFSDHEYYMSVLPKITDDNKRIERGLNRIKLPIEHLNQLKLQIVCKACLDEINNQLLLHERATVEILESNPGGMAGL